MRYQKHHRFSLIELLVVIAIIIILAGLTLYVISDVREKGFYTRWQGYSADLAKDSGLWAYYTMNDGPTQYFSERGITPSTYYRLRNQAMGDVSDIMEDARNKDGAIVGPVWEKNSRFKHKWSLTFDGSNDYVALGAFIPANHDGIEAITVASWVRSPGKNRQIIADFDDNYNWRLALEDAKGNENLGWDTRDAAGSIDDLTTSDNLDDGQWHHIVGWYDSTAAVPRKRIYVDGELLLSSNDPHSGEPLHYQVADRSRYGMLGVSPTDGNFNGNTNNLWFEGQIDEVAIFHRALTEKEIVDMYRMGRPR